MKLFPNLIEQTTNTSYDGKVSIITRTKNRPVLLARALASVLAQTYTNWHLYIINDGGDEDSVNKLVFIYERAFEGRLTVIHNTVSLGMEAASNIGLKKSECDFVVIHDDDDSWKPTFLKETVEFLKDSKHSHFAAVATNCELILERIVDDRVIEDGPQKWHLWKDRIDLRGMLIENNFPPICLLIRKSVLDSIGPYNEELKVLGDWDCNIRIMTIGDIGTINKALANYHHRHPEHKKSDYGNSVVAGLSLHQDYNVWYRNSLLRQLFQKEPGFIGLASAIFSQINLHESFNQAQLLEIKGRSDHISSQLNNIKEHSDHIALQLNNIKGHSDHISLQLNEIIILVRSINKMLRPFRWLWRQVYPLRVFIARSRGRI